MDMDPHAESLQAALLSGNPRAREEALRRILHDSQWPHRVIRYVERRGGVREDAEEVLSDALTELERNVREGKYRGDGNIEAYFFGIVAQQWKKRREKLGRRSRLFSLFAWWQTTRAQPQPPTPWFERQEVLDLFGELMADQGRHCREIMRLYQLDYSYDEIAQALGWNGADRVKTEKSRCLQRLREKILDRPNWKNLLNS